MSWGSAHLVAWALLAVASFTVTTVHDGTLMEDVRTRVFRHFYGAGQLLAAGVALGVATIAFRSRVSRAPGAAALAAFAATFTLGWTIVKNDYALLANRLAYIAPPLAWRFFFTMGCALSVPVAFLLGRFVLRGRRSVGVLGGIVGFVVARTALLTLVLPGTRLLLALASGVLIASALRGARLPAALSALSSRSSVARALPWALATLWGAYAVVIPPPAQVLFQLIEPPAAVLAPFIAELHAPVMAPSRTPDEVSASLSPEPAQPPSANALLPADGLVVLLTIDCLRADLLAGDAHAADLPNLVGLRRAGASFTQARSGGNMTIVALTSLFTGRYESQLAWTEHSTAHTRYLLPSEDPAPRFPELLTQANVATVAVSGIEWLDGASGILRGFSEERRLAPARGVANGEDLVGSAIERIERGDGRPMFVFLHLLDAHDPYDRAGTQGTELERYLRELALVDSEVGRLVAAVDARYAGRSIVIVSADHGEAFGEHGTSRHGHNVYDEVVHVPLIVRGAGVVPRVIADGVSTMDLGPTILDLFHLPAPATFMGTSLAPALAGGSVARSQPIAVEAPGFMAMVDQGWKVLRRKRYGTIELYHLTTDPGETRNVFRDADADAAARLRAMDDFFAAARAK